MQFLLLSAVFMLLGISSGTAKDAQMESEQPVSVPAQLTAAHLLTTIKPQFPPKPMKPCSNAMVTLDVVIGEEGKVVNASVSSGFEDFQESALTAVKQWTYSPYLLKGVPVAVKTQVQVFYVSNGVSGPFLQPDGKGGVKGGNVLALPPECGYGEGIKIKKPPQQ